MNELILAVVFLAVAVASYADIKKREVPDWLNYGLVAFGLGANALLSISSLSIAPLLHSIAGLAVFFGIAWLMFYSGQWGGGDSKMLMGIGASIGLPFSLSFPFIDFGSFLVAFWLNLLLAGVVYALLWAFVVALRSRKKFSAEFRRLASRHGRTRRYALALAAALLLAAVFSGSTALRIALAALSALVILLFYASIFSKAVESSCMLRFVAPSKLTEGDWIAKDVAVAGKVIAGPKDLGISKRQIARLRKLHSTGKVRRVLIKVGIPFVPSFLAAMTITVLYGNVFALLLRF